ncbi:MAG: dihydroneopterin aldolase [Chloroflexota bacterium]
MSADSYGNAPKPPDDLVRITGMRALCVIGINPWERMVKQEIVVDITLHTDLRAAGASDQIEDTVNYRDINKAVLDHIHGSSHGLIESLADNIARICLLHDGVRRADVLVRKPGALRAADEVSVEITRTR